MLLLWCVFSALCYSEISNQFNQFLRNPGKYLSVSAFAPICNPINCPWGQKAFKGYFGEDQEKWKEHDATELLKKWTDKDLNILIDVVCTILVIRPNNSNILQGTGDNFYKQGQLLPENLQAVASEKGFTNVKVNYQPDYDHSYYFIASFADDHVAHAAKAFGN